MDGPKTRFVASRPCTTEQYLQRNFKTHLDAASKKPPCASLKQICKTSRRTALETIQAKMQVRQAEEKVQNTFKNLGELPCEGMKIYVYTKNLSQPPLSSWVTDLLKKDFVSCKTT